MVEKVKRLCCAIYTRKSTEDGLEQDFNSLDAQREACAAYILSQASEGWEPVTELYDDGGYPSAEDEPCARCTIPSADTGKDRKMASNLEKPHPAGKLLPTR